MELQCQILGIEDKALLTDRYALLLRRYNAPLPITDRISVADLSSQSHNQHKLTQLQDSFQLANFIESRSTGREKAVIQASMKHSGGWLLVLPVSYLGLTMSTQEWRCAAWFRLGKPIYSSAGACPGCGTANSDIYGIHASICKSHGDLINRHNTVRDTLVSIAQSGNLNVVVEARHLLNDVVVGEKPADLLINNWRYGRSLCIDVCIANSLQFFQANRPFDPMEPLYAKENLKNEHYRARCLDRGLLFEPFVIGSLGGFTDAAIDIMKELGSAVANVHGLSRSMAINRVRQRVMFAVQKCQANSWIRRGVLGNIMLY